MGRPLVSFLQKKTKTKTPRRTAQMKRKTGKNKKTGRTRKTAQMKRKTGKTGKTETKTGKNKKTETKTGMTVGNGEDGEE